MDSVFRVMVEILLDTTHRNLLETLLECLQEILLRGPSDNLPWDSLGLPGAAWGKTIEKTKKSKNSKTPKAGVAETIENIQKNKKNHDF